jgi:F420H(2)-dependent quinone reductase
MSDPVTGGPDHARIEAALQAGGLIDITTTGRRSGLPHRIELVFFAFDDRLYISGRPGRRAWIANLKADARMVMHLKRGVRADLPARGRIVTDETERRAVLRRITASWGVADRLEVFVARAPLIEVILDTPFGTTGASTQRPQPA